MAPQPVTGLLSPEERARVKPAVFEDFSRRPFPEPAPEPIAPPVSDTAESSAALPPTEEPPWEESPAELTAAAPIRWEEELRAAYERGFEDGKIAAGALHEAEFRRYHQWLQRFDDLARALRLQLQELAEAMEQAAVRLAFVLAEHILGSELRQHPEQLEQLLHRALQTLPPEAHTLRIRLHPDTLEALQRAGSHIAAGQEQGITLVADPSVEPAGCIVESPWGSVDAQIREQLHNIREQLEC